MARRQSSNSLKLNKYNINVNKIIQNEIGTRAAHSSAQKTYGGWTVAEPCFCYLSSYLFSTIVSISQKFFKPNPAEAAKVISTYDQIMQYLEMTVKVKVPVIYSCYQLRDHVTNNGGRMLRLLCTDTIPFFLLFLSILLISIYPDNKS